MNAQSGSIAGLRVMIVDDSRTIRRSAELMLRQEGCEVVHAVDGFDALAKVVESPLDLIFVDILMPRLDGFQTCALLKRSARLASTPVVMLSSRDGMFDRARGRLAGSGEHLGKPFTKDALLAAVRTHARAAVRPPFPEPMDTPA
jgi:twitching motility two-component system response regulator PilG